MAAASAHRRAVILENIPQVRDIETTRKTASRHGAESNWGTAEHCIAHHLRPQSASPEASYELVKQMRASSLVLGPLGSPLRPGLVSLSPAAAPSARGPSISISRDWKQLGAKNHPGSRIRGATADRLREAKSYSKRSRLPGLKICSWPPPSPTGETVLQNCAREPEVADTRQLAE